MLPIADQTAGPNGLTFFVDTQGCLEAKKFDFFFKIFFQFFLPRATLGPLAGI